MVAGFDYSTSLDNQSEQQELSSNCESPIMYFDICKIYIDKYHYWYILVQIILNFKYVIYLKLCKCVLKIHNLTKDIGSKIYLNYILKLMFSF